MEFHLSGRRIRIAPQRKKQLFKLSFSRQTNTQNKVRQKVIIQGAVNGPIQTMTAATGGSHGSPPTSEVLPLKSIDVTENEQMVVDDGQDNQGGYQRTTKRKGKSRSDR